MLASDIDFPSAARHTQPLLTLRALEISMCFSIPKTREHIAQPIGNRPPSPQKPLVLRIASQNIAREHTEITQNQQCENEDANPSPSADPFHNNQHQAKQKQCIIQLIASVSSRHKTAQKIHHSTAPFPTWSNMRASTSSRPFPFSAENGITGTSSGSKSV